MPDAVRNTARVVLAGRLYEIQRDWGRAPVEAGPVRVSQVAVDKTERLHVLRRAKTPVVVLAPDGQFLFSYGEGRIFDPHGVSIDHLDRVWIVDREAHQVLCLSSTGEFLLSLGERHAPWWRAPFSHPTKVAVTADGEIYIGHRPGAFMTPHSLLIDHDDRVIVCDREPIAFKFLAATEYGWRPGTVLVGPWICSSRKMERFSSRIACRVSPASRRMAID